jgi:hypothetical protein
MGESGGVKISNIGDRPGISIENLYLALASYVSEYEGELKSSIEGMSGKTADAVDQGTLLNIQAKVQTWGTIVSTVTGTLRAVGDGLKSTTQNIRSVRRNVCLVIYSRSLSWLA